MTTPLHTANGLQGFGPSDHQPAPGTMALSGYASLLSRYDARARSLEDVLAEFPHLRVAQLLPRAVVVQ